MNIDPDVLTPEELEFLRDNVRNSSSWSRPAGALEVDRLVVEDLVWDYGCTFCGCTHAGESQYVIAFHIGGRYREYRRFCKNREACRFKAAVRGAHDP